jgi:hypothetical protein
MSDKKTRSEKLQPEFNPPSGEWLKRASHVTVRNLGAGPNSGSQKPRKAVGVERLPLCVPLWQDLSSLSVREPPSARIETAAPCGNGSASRATRPSTVTVIGA